MIDDHRILLERVSRTSLSGHDPTSILGTIQRCLRDFAPRPRGNGAACGEIRAEARRSNRRMGTAVGFVAREGETDTVSGWHVLRAAERRSDARTPGDRRARVHRRRTARVRRGMDLIVAADSGLDAACAAGACASTWWSATWTRFPTPPSSTDTRRGKVLRFPADKDETDTEIGLRVMRERGCTDITLAGGGGGRIDHLLGIAALFEREAPPPRGSPTGKKSISSKRRASSPDGREHRSVSPWASASRLSSAGLQWPLDGLEFPRGYGGISNRVTGPRVAIKVGSGKFLVIRSRSHDTDAPARMARRTAPAVPEWRGVPRRRCRPPRAGERVEDAGKDPSRRALDGIARAGAKGTAGADREQASREETDDSAPVELKEDEREKIISAEMKKQGIVATSRTRRRTRPPNRELGRA